MKKFSRYDENDLPVFYFSRKTPIIITSQNWLVNPQINFEYKTMNYMIQNDTFFEFELFGQLFGIVIDENWEDSYNEYIETNKKLKQAENLIYSAHAISEIDVYNSFAKLALSNNYVRPIIKQNTAAAICVL